MKKPACKCWSAKPRPSLRRRGDANGVTMSTSATAHAVLINSLVVATGQIAWTIGSTRKATDFVAHLAQAYHCLPGYEPL